MIENISWFGSQFFTMIAGCLLISLLFIKYGQLYRAGLLLVSLTVLPLTFALKTFFKTSRPELYSETPIFFEAEKYGFPSFHVLFYSVFFGFLIYALYKTSSIPKFVRLPLSLLAGVHILFIGSSRIYLGAHSFIDVLGGYIIGGLILTSLITADKFLYRKSEQK